jgi:GNAT superfamily N-acetyltransferase
MTNRGVMTRLIRCNHLQELRDLALPFLAEREAEHGLLVGLILGTDVLPDRALAAVVTDGDRVQGVALRLDSRTIVSRVDDATALELLATTVAADAATMMVAGSPPTVYAIRDRLHRAIAFSMDQMIYATGAVKPVSGIPEGSRRPAQPRDREVLIDAHVELNASLGASESRADAAIAMDRMIASGSLSVWETPGGEVVATVGTAGPTLHGIRVNYVYTPRERRGLGYASALVRDLTQSLLDGGREFVFLHADRANPTATRLYERLGYDHIADFAMIRLAAATPASS